MAIKLILSGDIHLHFHGDSDSQNNGAIARLEKKVDSLTLKFSNFMATSQERYDAIIGRLDTITNDIAADYQKLLDEARTKTVSDESLAKGEANVARLEAIGASVDNPLPPDEPNV